MPPERNIDEQIRKHLAVLAYIIENSNQRNLQDINIYSEGTTAGILNLLWGSKLIDLNREFAGNFPAIDLLDQDRGLYIQVTSDDSLGKIRSTYEKSLEMSEEKKVKISPKILLLKFNKPKREKTFTIIKNESDKGVDITFDNKNVICLNDLAHEIQNADAWKKSQILDFIKLRIPIESESHSFSLEVYMLRKFFESLAQSDRETDSIQPVSESEIEKKKAAYSKFWAQIQTRYRSVLDQQRERSFKAAFDRLGQADRLRLTQYLGVESMIILDTLESPNPNEVIELLKQKIIEKIKLPLVSEIDITHFLYYEFHHCYVLPIYEEVPA